MSTITPTPDFRLPSLGCDPDGPACRGQRGKVFILCQEADLTKGERLTVASIVADRTISTFTDLNHREASTLIDALNGWHAVTHLLDTQRPWSTDLLGPDMPCSSYRPDPNEWKQPASREDIDRIVGMCWIVGIDRLDVFDLAHLIIGAEITSWAELYPSGARRLVNALRGYVTVTDVLNAR